MSVLEKIAVSAREHAVHRAAAAAALAAACRHHVKLQAAGPQPAQTLDLCPMEPSVSHAVPAGD